MPVAHIHVLQGHPKARLKALIGEVSDIMVRVLQAPKDRLEVWITEVDPDLWGISGAPASEVLATQPRASVEMPFVQMVLLEGRPIEQHHALIAEITEAIVRCLAAERERIRIHIAQASPDSWGIGGTPASIKRAAEIAARRESR